MSSLWPGISIKSDPIKGKKIYLGIIIGTLWQHLRNFLNQYFSRFSMLLLTLRTSLKHFREDSLFRIERYANNFCTKYVKNVNDIDFHKDTCTDIFDRFTNPYRWFRKNPLMWGCLLKLPILVIYSGLQIKFRYHTILILFTYELYRSIWFAKEITRMPPYFLSTFLAWEADKTTPITW